MKESRGETSIIEEEGTSTFRSVMQCSGIMRERGWSTVLVVSDPYHLHRAIFTFRRLGIQAGGSAAEGGRYGELK